MLPTDKTIHVAGRCAPWRAAPEDARLRPSCVAEYAGLVTPSRGGEPVAGDGPGYGPGPVT